MESLGRRKNESNKRDLLANGALSAKQLLKLDYTAREETIKESANQLLGIMQNSGAVEYNNITSMYNTLAGESLIVRREDPLALVGAIADGERVSIDFAEDERYSNAIEWNPRLGSKGMSNAFSEGYGQYNGVVTVVGFRRNQNFDVQALPDAAQVFAGLDRTYVRSVRGSYDDNDILFVTLRIPSSAFPGDQMTEEEREKCDAYLERKESGDRRNPFFVYRGYLFTSRIKRQ